MALSIETKKAMVAEVNSVAASSQSAVAADYRGLTVSEMTRLRTAARDAGVFVKVVKNTLARRAVEGTSFECMKEAFSGPLLLAFSSEDPGAAARVVKAFGKDSGKLTAVAVSIGGELYGAEALDRLASLPTLDEARAQLLGLLQEPGTRLARVLAEPGSMLARALDARGREAA